MLKNSGLLGYIFLWQFLNSHQFLSIIYMPKFTVCNVLHFKMQSDQRFSFHLSESIPFICEKNILMYAIYISTCMPIR